MTERRALFPVRIGSSTMLPVNVAGRLQHFVGPCPSQRLSHACSKSGAPCRVVFVLCCFCVFFSRCSFAGPVASLRLLKSALPIERFCCRNTYYTAVIRILLYYYTARHLQLLHKLFLSIIRGGYTDCCCGTRQGYAFPAKMPLSAPWAGVKCTACRTSVFWCGIFFSPQARKKKKTGPPFLRRRNYFLGFLFAVAVFFFRSFRRTRG